MQRIKADNQESEQKTYEDNKIQVTERLIKEKMIQDKLMENVYNNAVWLRKRQKNLRIKFVTLNNKNVREIFRRESVKVKGKLKYRLSNVYCET